MTRLFTLLIVAFLCSSCSTSRLVAEYVNPENANFRINKILVVGLTPDGGLQRQFEYSLVKALEAENVIAIKSVDYFESTDDENNQSEENLANLESELLKAGFDAVLFSKVKGQVSKVSIGQSYRNLSKTFQSFSDYYNENKTVYQTGQTDDYPVYNTETSLYCLCPDKEQDLIWRGNIDIIDPPRAETTIKDYVTTLVRTLKKHSLLIGK